MAIQRGFVVFIRTTRVKRQGKTYSYAQLVESHRVDGKPRQRLIASLGRLSELQVANLRTALAAAARGEPVALAEATDTEPVVRRSVDFLPIAVVLETARRIGLTRLLSDLLDRGPSSTPPSVMVLALVCHRLLAPGSKLSAVRWFERTALPQLLGVRAAELNNSRIHRVLDALCEAAPELQTGVAALHRQGTEVDRVLFLDVSDASFEGLGPESAQRAKTKEGAYKKKIGIVLAVNRKGQPLHWQVVPGRRHDSQSMRDLAGQLRRLRWAADMPMVFDRAMGKAAHLQDLQGAGVRFLTLLTREAFAGYAHDDLELPALEAIRSRRPDDPIALATAIEALRDAGFEPVGRRLWGKELGVRRHRRRSRASTARGGRPWRRSPAAAARAMRLAEELTGIKEQTGRRYEDVAKQLGLGRGKAHHLRRLMRLTADIREVVRQGGCAAPLRELERIAALAPAEQPAAFEEHRIEPTAPHDSSDDANTSCESSPHAWRFEGPALRVHLTVDPVALIAARAKADRVHGQILAKAEDLDRRLAQGRKSQRVAAREILALLDKHAVTDCYEATADEHGMAIERDEATWAHRRRTDGVRLFALHPDLELGLTDTVDLYSAKMAVEVDFHVIKSTVRIRPVHHSTDRKVRAHVDLCVLALAIERALTEALADTTAAAALEALDNVRLIDVMPDPRSRPVRVVTTPTTEQRRLVERLGMAHLLVPPGA